MWYLIIFGFIGGFLLGCGTMAGFAVRNYRRGIKYERKWFSENRDFLR